MTVKTLDVVALPLQGRHLIEASAGTGKTFNITRLYLRLLLEKALTVQQILVMTFTNAATQEIRGRIAQSLREAQGIWRKLAKGENIDDLDLFYRDLYQRCPGEQHLALIEAALLELDDASVFTIHGFCNRVLSLLSFSTGAPMNLSLATETSDLYEQAAMDWVRLQSHDDNAYLHLCEMGWHDPLVLLNTFGAAIRSGIAPTVLNEDDISADSQSAMALLEQHYLPLKQQVVDSLFVHKTMLFDALVNPQKGTKRDERESEWTQLVAWLECAQLTMPPKAVGMFINGNRYRGNTEIKTIFEPLKTLKSAIENEVKSHDEMTAKRKQMLPALELVKQGVEFIRDHVAAQKQQLGIVDFDDLIAQLHEKLQSDDGSLTNQLRQLYPVAMVDEFQDTDKAQYEILAALYPPSHSKHVLLMIGDPKQAIYGFRGGDIFTYLTAGRQAQYHWVMDTNWRSVDTMVNAYNRLFFGAPLDAVSADTFGYGIGYEPVKSTPHAKAAQTPLMDKASNRSALTYLVFEPQDDKPTKESLQQALCKGLCDEITRLLNDATIGTRTVKPSDIAILVRSGGEANIVKRALKEVGLDAVFFSDKGSLFASAQALDVLRVLNGIWHGSDVRKVASALRSPLFGYSHEQLVDMLHFDNDEMWEMTLAKLQSLRAIWTEQGVMSLLMYLLQTHYVANESDPERALTNYLHLSEVLQQSSNGFPQPEQLIVWLNKQISRPDSADTLVQRLESDAQLIQIITQHGSKGLEYPIVFVPFASDYRDPARAGQALDTVCRFYDASEQSIVLQLGNSHHAVNEMQAQGDAEAMRLLYVAVTRAAHRCYLGVAPFKQYERSSVAMAVGLKGRSWREAIDEIVTEQPDATAFLDVADIESKVLDDCTEVLDKLIHRQGEVDIDNDWRLYSFSALARHTASIKQDVRDEEYTPTTIVVENEGEETQFRFEFEKGANAGNLLHDMLEHTDFSQPNWEVDGQGAMLRFGMDDDDKNALFAWIDETLDTPMKLEYSAEVRLADLTANQVLKEAEFYFPMRNTLWGKLANLLQQHRRDLSEFAKPLTVPWLDHGRLKGMMHGFIDLIFEHNGKYYVADYKSTHLGSKFSDYSMTNLIHNNQAHLYDLQYLIYALALHRFLRAKMADYQPELHFGGIAYLYLRGMSPINTANEGVFFTPIAPELLTAMDQLFDDEDIPA